MTAYDIVFPVFGGKIDEKGFLPHEIYGTAFYIGNDFFVTCAHTIQNADSHEEIAIGYQNDKGSMSFSNVSGSEIFEKNDSGILQTHISRATPCPWRNDKLVMLDDVISVGFPYGLDRENLEILVRSFKGHISLVGYNHNFNKNPHYELSYQIPKGLSGGPLLFENKGLQICGVTIGNEITEMIVNSFQEKDQDGDKLVIYEKTEALHRGIAMQTQSFFELKSDLLSSTFIDYLTNQKLLI